MWRSTFPGNNGQRLDRFQYWKIDRCNEMIKYQLPSTHYDAVWDLLSPIESGGWWQSRWFKIQKSNYYVNSNFGRHKYVIAKCACLESRGKRNGKPSVAMILWKRVVMTSSNGNIFRVTGPLCEEFTGHRWIPLTKATDAELWCFLWSVPE